MKPATDKRDRILAAAIELFSHYGFAKTSLEDIARSANIAKATIYYYFPSKEELFVAAIQLKAEELFAALNSEIEAAPDFNEKLSCFLRLPMKYIFDNMPILVEALRQIPPNFLQKLDENRQDYRNRMNDLLARIMDQGKAQGIINEQIDSGRFSELINDWFLMGDSWFDASDKERIIQRIERDHELIIQLLLFGIVKQTPAATSKRNTASKTRKQI
ncbi:MAG: TetR/AcrR family transcriptional regulator [Candidatus Syntrophosphaera sp.]|nr:TetR/AcrR family transcriptional regulator [Candidatus Syntrophosphaera sp.]